MFRPRENADYAFTQSATAPPVAESDARIGFDVCVELRHLIGGQGWSGRHGAGDSAAAPHYQDGLIFQRSDS
jgi:hypothetical protein